MRYLFFISFLLISVGLNAQELPDGEVDVIKNFDARLLETDRLIIAPQLPPLDTQRQRQTYNTISRPLTVDYLPPKIRPLAIRGERTKPAYKGLLRAGAGLPTALLLDGRYDALVGDNFDVGAGIHHLSMNNSGNVENQRFAESRVALDGTYYFEQGFAIRGDLGYSRDVVHFYGYNDLNEEKDTEFSFDAEDVKQYFNIFDIGADIFNGERTAADFNYSAGVDFYHLTDNYAASENGVRLEVEGSKWFNDSHPLNIKLITDFTSYQDTAKQSLNNYMLQPNFTFQGETFKARIGINLTSHDDDYKIFPDLEVSTRILGDLLGAYVGATGTLQKNSYRSLTDYNPFLTSRNKLRNTSYYEFFGGVNGAVTGVDYDARISYRNSENMPLYLLNSPTDSIARFDVVYDSVSVFTIKGSLSGRPVEDIEVIAGISQQFFTTEREEKPWHLPSLTVNAGVRYHGMEDKLLVKGDVFLQNGVPYKDKNGDAQNLGALFDISLGADYYFTEQLGGFIQLNNLANNKRQRWHRYPTFGINVLAGITARF